MKVESYSKLKPYETKSKQYSIWINSSSQTWPLIYLQRPKWIKDDNDWEMIVDSIEINLKRGTEFN